MDDRDAAALRVWAPTADALARGEQVFELLADGPREVAGLPHPAFWILPAWDGQEALDLTEPYRDRLRAMEELRHDDGRVRLKYYASAEYAERLPGAEALRRVDGDHTLTFSAVRRMFDRSEAVTLLVLRVFEREEAALLGEEAVRAGPTDWSTLPEAVPLGRQTPVLDDESFLAEKARLLQRTGTMRAV